MKRVGISGGYGRLGSTIAEAVDAADDLDLGARYDPAHGDPSMLAGHEVIVETTRPDVVLDNLERWAALGSHVVVGTSGFTPERVAEVERLWPADGPRCLIVPNFSIGAVVMMRFAEMAAPLFPSVEIVESHRPEKLDAPSGTALETARRIAARRSSAAAPVDQTARGEQVEGIPVHSLRLHGVIADQDVVFGDPGQTLLIRHHTHSMQAFVPGALAAIRAVTSLDAPVTVGLDQILF